MSIPVSYTHLASRYTEVKLEKICQELFSDIDKDTVDLWTTMTLP